MAAASERSQTAAWAMPPSGDLAAGGLERLGASRTNRHAGAGLGKGKCDRTPDAAAPSGDNGALAGNLDLHASSLGSSGAACAAEYGNGRATPMIKSVSLLTRKAGLSHEQFVKHWLEVHAPLAHSVPGL